MSYLVPAEFVKPIKYNIQKPTGNRIAPISGEPVWTAELIANTAANARIAPAINALIKVSLADMVKVAEGTLFIPEV
jgi:hypothetical protein